MRALDDAVLAHMTHAAGSGADPLTDSLFDQMLAAHFPPSRRLACQQARRYQVSITRPDGSSDNWLRTGGNSCDHALEAADIAGTGGVVRVVPLDLARAA